MTSVSIKSKRAQENVCIKLVCDSNIRHEFMAIFIPAATKVDLKSYSKISKAVEDTWITSIYRRISQ